MNQGVPEHGETPKETLDKFMTSERAVAQITLASIIHSSYKHGNTN
jgi:hypothetical protein